MKLLALVFALLIGVCVAFTPATKQLAGPPEEFKDHDIPSPLEAAVTQKAAYMYAKYQGDGIQNFELPVDSHEVFAFNFMTPQPNAFTLALQDANGKNVDLKSHEVKGHWPIGDASNYEIPVSTYLFYTPVRGTWHLAIKASGFQVNLNSTYPDVAIMIFNESPIKIHSYLQSYNTEKGTDIGLLSSVTEQEMWAANTVPAPLVSGQVSWAEMEIFTPDGTEVDVPMYDDGLHGDGLANDGIYGATIKATQAGQYLATAVIEGTTSDGKEFIRSTEHIITVVDDSLELTGTATGVGNGNRIDVYLGVNQASNNKYRAYAEVWGTDANGNQVAVCWISSLVNVQSFQNQPSVKLELDLNWPARVNAKAPYTLKNAYVQEINSFIPISEKSSIPLTMQSNVDKAVSRLLKKANNKPIQITDEMRQGVRPLYLSNMKSTNSTANTCNLVLLHGYCAGVNPWQTYNAADFTNACFFLYKDGNLLHDKYALKVADYVNSMGLSSFGGIGHSQGGLVLTHLHNYYWTALENAKGKRLIQSMGSPYQGCSGAGSAANLIKIFGVACGANSDLTVDGAKLWNTGITSATRKDVFYYTTTYQQGKLLGDYCNVAVNLLLGWPNDGTTELKYADLTGGNNLGNKEKWCHTTDMGYPAQYTDTNRNKDMNTNAAR